jgi:hypothetical protein
LRIVRSKCSSQGDSSGGCPQATGEANHDLCFSSPSFCGR